MKLPFIFLSILLVFVALCDATPTCDADGKIYTVETQVDGSIYSLDWLGPDFETVFVRTSTHTLLRSTSGGAEWVDQSSKLTDFRDVGPWSTRETSFGVRNVYTTANDDKLLLLGYDGRIWTTADRGETYTYKQTSETPFRTLIPHPEREDTLLATSSSLHCYNSTLPGDCHLDLYKSTDFAETWELVDTYVSQVSWDTTGPVEDMFWYSSWTDKTGPQSSKTSLNKEFGYKNDENQYESLLENCAGFLHKENVIFVAQINEETEALKLIVSTDHGAHFNDVVFTNDALQENRYTILDTTEGFAFINVDHSEDRTWGNLYVSGAFDEEFTLSLEYNHRGGSVDFAKVNGLDGIYVANTVTAEEEETNYITHITFDGGALWEKIKTPEGSICLGTSCSLNLNGKGTNWYGQVFSRESTVGLLLATGNVGPYLDTEEDQTDTYFSRDAGYSWTRILSGPHVYEYGDHGSLLIFVDNTVSSQTIKYSWTQGHNSTECQISSEAFEITNVIVEPTAKARKFNVYGTRLVEGKLQGIIVHLDFTTFHERKCEGISTPYPENPDSDYEVFIPHGTGDCLLGQKIAVTRRRQQAACYVGFETEPEKLLGQCPCTRADYECDECYEIDLFSETEECKLVPDCTVVNKPVCTNGVELVTTGYKLVAGDVCVSPTGDPYAPQPKPCGTAASSSSPSGSTSAPKHYTIVIVVSLLAVLLIVVVIGGLWYGSKKNANLRASLGKCFPCCREDSEKAFYGKLSSFDLDEEAGADLLDAEAIDDFSKD